MKILRKNKRSVGFTCIATCLIIYLKELYADSDWTTINSYYSDEGDALPSAENLSFAPKSDISLFFHETSFNGILTARKGCAVEAAARTHPKLDVYVLFSAPVTNHKLETTCLAKLFRFPNVKFLRVHIAEFSKGTAVQPILQNDLKKSRFPMKHTADILKILTLNKWGGISLDTDMIVIRPLDLLPDLNWIVQHGGKFVAPGLLSFGKDEVGSNVTSSILAEILKTYNPKDRPVTGSMAIEKVIKRICPIKMRWDGCNGIGIYSNKFFYPVNKIILNNSNKISKNQDSFSFQWDFRNSRRRNTMIYLTQEKLARKYCPSIFRAHREEFLDV